MKLSNKTNALIFVLFALLTFTAYGWFANSAYFENYKTWTQNNFVLFVIFLFLIKVIGIVWPPITGGIFTLGAIPLIGWTGAYLVDLAGSMVGGVICYYLGLKYGEKVLLKVFDKSVVARLKNIKIKKGREIEAVFIYRILFGFTILEAIYYGAGLLKVNFKNFFIGATLSHIAIGIPSFYLIQNVVTGKNTFLTILSLVVAIPIFLKYKSRYFE